MNDRVLQRENVEFCGTGGVSQENAATGFRPAFFDCESRTIYPSRFADGTPAPIHLLDGLPPEVVVARTASGRVATVRPSIWRRKFSVPDLPTF
jgi:hypothetical protein